MFGLFGKKEEPSKVDIDTNIEEPVNGSSMINDAQLHLDFSASEELNTVNTTNVANETELKSDEQIIQENSIGLEQLAESIAETNDIQPVAESQVTSEAEIEKSVEAEIQMLQRLFSDPTIIGYSDRNEQAIVYANVLPKEYTANDTILDVGCGIGDLYAYIEEVQQISNPKYTGVDYNPNMIMLAKKKFIDISNKFYHVDLLDIPQDGGWKHDWVVAVCAFNIAIQDDMDTYIKTAIDTMYKLANKGVSFNCLSKLNGQADDYEGAFIAHNPEKLFKHVLDTYGKVTINHSYMDSDYTITIYK